MLSNIFFIILPIMNNTHDLLFKENFSKKENALDLLKAVLPLNIFNKIDTESLTLENASFTDKKLKQYFSDLVYSCSFSNTKIKISFLFEHKSYFVKYPHLQLLRYFLKIWEQNNKNKVPLEPVIPIIFYHGKKKWEYIDIEQYFNNLDKDLFKYIPSFQYELIDLSTYTDDEIKKRLFGTIENKILASIMKNIHNKKIIDSNIRKYLEIGQLYFNTETGLKFLEALLIYLFCNMPEESKDIIINETTKITSKEVNIMTIAMKLRQEGKVEGKIEGKIEEKKSTLYRQMNKKFQLSHKDVELINTCDDTAKLDDALDEFVFADNKETVLMKLR
ncbi:MAG TPA: hypothetical protein DDY71_05655 [Spirochaetia bacterium]|nr:MAG: hypothetical protein A2Y30_00700 [Spirochaetes bacterium GWE1_32_154]HBI37111.1 hypothetical protein [Spirochaetia bacterium]